VLHPACDLLPVVREESDALAPLDAVSRLAATPRAVDDFDLEFTGSQRAWVLPPGMAMGWTAGRAEAGEARARLPRFYWDFTAYRGETMPFTPAVPVLFAMEAGVRLMLREGREQVFARHAEAAALVQGELEAMGLALVAPEGYRSPTVTAAWLPEGVEWAELSRRLAERGVTVAGGLGELKGKVLRFGHLGWMTAGDLEEPLRVLADTIRNP